jgi:hypothetical protein
VSLTTLVLLAIFAAPSERDARRSGGGVRVGHWQLMGDVAGDVTLPLVEGYQAIGMDRHLAYDNSIAVWAHRQESSRTESGLLGSSTVKETREAFLFPLFTGLRLHPFTGPDDTLEPVVLGAAGFVVFYEKRESERDGESAESTAAIGFGAGLRAAAGVEAHLSKAFGASLLAGYQWLYMFDEVQAQKQLRGFTLSAALTYRFQS